MGLVRRILISAWSFFGLGAKSDLRNFDIEWRGMEELTSCINLIRYVLGIFGYKLVAGEGARRYRFL